ncbi:MAG: glycosyltransferase family 2 protein [Coriobacteriia bacterium]
MAETASRADQPLVSVLTPSYNQGSWLADNLRSVAVQTYPRVEHIVMDGGSTDESVAVLESAEPPVIWRSEPDNGQPHALNKAFAASTGEIIGWLNSDDAFYDARVVSDVVDYFQCHPDVDVVYGHAARITAQGKIVYFVWVPPFSYRLMKLLCFLIQPAVFIRRRVLEDRFIDESYQFAMDWELWLRIGRTHRFARMGRVLAIDRLQPNRKMKTWAHVLEENRVRLGQAYGVHMPWYYGPVERLYYLATRLGGGRFVFRMSSELAFSGEQDTKAVVFRRQMFSRKAKWPHDFR